jgi:hypothetical protein
VCFPSTNIAHFRIVDAERERAGDKRVPGPGEGVVEIEDLLVRFHLNLFQLDPYGRAV